MVQNCCAVGCYNKAGARNTASFHTFPFKNPELLAEWISRINRQPKDGKLWFPTRNDRLCSDHFLPQDYFMGLDKPRLRGDSVPSLFPHHPAHKQVATKPRRPSQRKRKAQSTSHAATPSKVMASEGKRDFGSFHSSNVQELLTLSDKDYVAPDVPFKQPSFSDIFKSLGGQPSFGHEMKKDFFLIEEDCCFLNHGAFGATLKPALDTARQWQIHAERQPLRFFDRELMPLLVHVCRRLSKFVNCSPTDLVLVNNATFGINSVLGSYPWSHSDVIVTFNITYGAVKKLVNHICTKTGATNREAEINFPVKNKHEIVDVLNKQLDAGDVTMVIIDHIPSNAPIVMPIAEMVKLCRERQVKVLVDGAHALGSLPLDLQALDPDYYVSNCHKWLCSPKGVAFLYVRPALQGQVTPAVISHGLGSGFSSEFVWAGLHDYSPMLALHTVLDFWEAVGPSTIRGHIHKLLNDAAVVLMEKWRSRLAAPITMFGSMLLVELPADLHQQLTTVNYTAAENVQNCLYHGYNIEVPIKSLQGRLYARVSAHIHNELSDYEKLADAVSDICTTTNTIFQS